MTKLCNFRQDGAMSGQVGNAVVQVYTSDTRANHGPTARSAAEETLVLSPTSHLNRVDSSRKDPEAGRDSSESDPVCDDLGRFSTCVRASVTLEAGERCASPV